MINKYKYLLIVVLSFFYVLSFAPYTIFPLGIISVAGLSYVFSVINTKKGLIFSSLLSSFVISIFGMYWIVYASEYTFDSMFLGGLVLIGFSLLYSVFIFFISIPIYLTKNRGMFYFFVLVISWSAMDAFKLYFLGGFPWFLSAYMWSFDINIIQIVSVIGVMGLSIFTYALIFSILFLFNQNISFYLKLKLFGLFFIIFIAFYFYGSLRVSSLNDLQPEKEVSIRLVQTDIPQKEKMNLQDMQYFAQSVINQAIEVENNKPLPEIILLPEASFIFLSKEEMKNIGNQIPLKSHIITGAMRFDEYNNIYNSIINLNSDGYQDHYDKIKLVPFGEKLPLSDYFPNVFNFVGLSNFSSGTELKILSVNNYNFIANICFEGLFPLEGISAKNIDFIVNSANEGWFNESIELKQNWDIFRYRSIEVGTPSIKISNTGVSGIYDLVGNPILELKQFTKLNKDFLLPIKKVETIYSKINYQVINYLLFLFYIFIYLRFITKKRLNK